MKKAMTSIVSNQNMKIFVLVPIETLTTKWFGETVDKYDLHVPNGRIKFEDPTNPSAKSPAFGSVVVELGNHTSGKILKFDLG